MVHDTLYIMTPLAGDSACSHSTCRYSNYSQAPGLIATPGGLVLSHGGKGSAPPAGGLGTTGHGECAVHAANMDYATT